MSIKNLFFGILIINILIGFSLSIDKEYLIDFFKSFLQKHISNKNFLKAVDLILKLISTKTYPGNYENNLEVFEKNHLPRIVQNKGYIEDQCNYYDMKYGDRTISDSGCQIIATYNALYDLTGEINPNFPDMIDYFEKDGIIFHGFFGTAPQAIEKYFKYLGFETMSSTEKEDYTNIQDNCDAFVFTYYNDIDDIMDMIHTINISKINGKYFLHNSGYGYLREYDSILDVVDKINGGRAKDIFLIGIKKNKK